jgi:hypothetical protein
MRAFCEGLGKDPTGKSGQGSIFIPRWAQRSEWSVLVDSALSMQGIVLEVENTYMYMAYTHIEVECLVAFASRNVGAGFKGDVRKL